MKQCKCGNKRFWASTAHFKASNVMVNTYEKVVSFAMPSPNASPSHLEGPYTCTKCKAEYDEISELVDPLAIEIGKVFLDGNIYTVKDISNANKDYSDLNVVCGHDVINNIVNDGSVTRFIALQYITFERVRFRLVDVDKPITDDSKYICVETDFPVFPVI